MIKLAKLFSSNKNGDLLSKIDGDNFSTLIFNDLLERISKFSIHFEMKSKLKTYQRYSETKFQAEFPSLYLDIEEFLILQQEYNSITKYDLRNELLQLYPEILEHPEFYVIFLEYNSQKIVLSRLFLKDMLEKAKDLLGNFQDPFLKQAEQELNNPLYFKKRNIEIDYNSSLKSLQDTSILLQNKLGVSLGENAMLSIYNNSYNKYFSNYYLLESFTVTINLVPEELLVLDNANMPSKGQMHRLLKSQISALEDINVKLSKEVLERKNVQKELEINERLYAAVLHNSLNANVIFKKDGTILRSNDKAQDLFGYGLNLYENLPNAQSDLLKSSINNIEFSSLVELTNQTINFESESEEGTYFYKLRTSPVFIDGDVLYFCVVEDVTKEVKSFELLKEAKDIAEKSAQAKTTFLSNMSHEIRTPLNIILGLSELFNKDTYTGSKEEFENIDIIKFSAENLLTLVNDILDFSKIEAGKMSLQSVDFNFYEVISNLTAGFTYKATEKGLEFSTILDDNIPKFIVGDQYRLSQILNNLLSNALKFTKEGQVQFEIKLVEDFQEKIQLQFLVKDTGMGNPEQNIKNIYDSFYQTFNDKEERPEGTGLGLSITKQIVSLLGGVLEVESTLNKGTIFSFKLNYEKSSLTTLVEGKLNIEEEKTLFRGKNILVAEDNKLNQLLMKQLLSKWEVDVAIANNGAEALKLLKAKDFDLVLMDIHMPICNGLEATKLIRNLPEESKKSIPIVACSADVFPESRKQAEDAGVNYYMTKPVSTNSVREVLILFTNKNPSID